MRFRGNGRDVGPRSANVSRFTRPPEVKLTRFGAGMAILLRKWCTFAIQCTDSQPRSEPTELRSAAPPLWAGAASFCPAGTRTSNTDTLPLESSPLPFVERLRRSDRFEAGLRITGARALRLGGGFG